MLQAMEHRVGTGTDDADHAEATPFPWLTSGHLQRRLAVRQCLLPVPGAQQMLLCSLREPLPPPLTFAAPVGHQILDTNNLNGGVYKFFQDMRHSKLR